MMVRNLSPAAALLVLAHSELVPVRIGLKQQNLDKAYDYVLSVSDPSSSTYGRHWSKEDTDRAFRPRSDSATAVLNYLSELGIEDAALTPNGYWITLSASPGQADILKRLPDGDHPSTRGHVDFVDATFRSRMTARKRQVRPKTFDIQQPAHVPVAPPYYGPPPYTPGDLSHCATNTTPPCIRALYSIPKNVTPVKGGEIGIFEAGSESYAQQDLDLFFRAYATQIPNGTHPYLQSINNGSGPASVDDAGSEAALDFQTVYGLLGNSNISFLSLDNAPNYNENSASLLTGTLISMLDAVDTSFCTADDKAQGNQCNFTQLPKVVSISYSEPELATDTAATQVRLCTEFMKLSLHGHTIVAASGDYGVAANPQGGDLFCSNTGCLPTEYHNQALLRNLNGTIFQPHFPSSCPYVLSVGGTQIDKPSGGLGAETAMNIPGAGQGACNPFVVFSSGGGFANYFPRPDYQSKALSTYFAKHDPGYKHYTASGRDISSNSSHIGQNRGIYSRNGRGIPDVSAIGKNFMIYLSSALYVDSGTSAATPVWAAVVTLLNQERAAIGKSPVGFINPALYQHPEAFHDITKGNNPGCLTQGFSAVEGWDPVTGLGTPDFEKLVAVFTALR